MNDEELNMWKREWRSLPAVPIELIRKVERQTVYMRLGKWVLILPLLILLAVTAGAVMRPTPGNILLAVGMWLFTLILSAADAGKMKLRKKLLAPAAETTAAYLELSIERCRFQSEGLRIVKFAVPLMTAFILVADYAIFRESGKFESPIAYWIMLASLAWASAPIWILFIVMRRVERKARAELAYLLNLKRQVEGEEA
jgi:hypothetical protein